MIIILIKRDSIWNVNKVKNEHMKKITCLILTLGFFITLSAQELQGGKWETGKDNTLIETYQKEGAWFGKVITSDNPKAKIGNDVIRDVRHKDGKWKGKFYVAKRDRLVDAVLEPGNDQLSIEISAMGRSRTLVWKKVK